jgi:hypothetical protein
MGGAGEGASGNMKLKCGNTPVMDLLTGEVFESALLPIAAWNKEDVFGWLERRVYSGSNTAARRIAQRRNEPTGYKLSLSDSYWVAFDDTVKFEDISPYYQEFGTLDFVKGLTEPTLRLMGTFDKWWESKAGLTCIRKSEAALVAQIEAKASGLAAKLGIGDRQPCLYAGSLDGLGTVYIRNLSTPQQMLLDFGSLLPPGYLKEGFDLDEVRRMYGIAGLNDMGGYILRVNLFDTIIGNEDRRYNQGNWGFFKNTETGAVSAAPAYDFNLAYSLDIDEELLQQRVPFLGNVRNDALNLLHGWKPAVKQYCEDNHCEVWYRNLCRLEEKIRAI